MPHPVRRIVTGHDGQGRAIVQRDEMLPTEPVNGGEAYFAKLWTTASSPADNTDPADAALRATGLTCPGGSVLRVVDIPPGQRSPMHRTHSTDYGIVLQGELQMELDGGDVVTLHSGDVVVQRGTNHAWVNRSDAAVRMVFVLIDALPLNIAGRILDASH